MKRENGLIIIEKKDEEFPEKLRCIPDPPERLYAMGDIRLLKTRGLAIVGSRKCSEYGRQTAMKIASRACENGLTIISGMAMGIDNFAHQGAFHAEGKTIACLASGPDICYPARHRELYERIKREGLILSEYPPKTRPLRFMFPRRNRIISGLSDAVCVVEAGTESGALITADHAAQQGKTVFAVPGNITSPYSLGTNKLIMDGAQPIAVIDDIFYGMGICPAVGKEVKENLGKDEQRVYEFVLANGESPIDLICSRLGSDPVLTAGIVSVLEMKGLVSYTLGKVFVIGP